jgi:predicted ATP-grasp superfamily ATP-dependent carboligase
MIRTRGNFEPVSVLIPDGEDLLEIVKVLRCLGQVPEFTVHVLSKTRSPLARFSRHCAHLHHHSSKNDDEWIEAIEAIARQCEIDVVLPVTLRGVQLISQRREAISKVSAIPPIPEYELIELVRNKWSLYQFAIQNGLPTVPSAFIGKAGEPISASPDIDSIEYPALLKPTSQRGGFGIVKVDSPSDLENAWKDERIIKGSEYILQSYIPGVDVSFAVFCQSGEVIAYTLWKELLPSKEPFRVPRLVEYIEDERAIDIGRRLVSAIGWDGVADIDLIFDKRDQTVKILEINPRFWQSLLGSLTAGVNFPLMACLTAVGAECPKMKQTRPIKYARPSASFHMLLSRLLGKKLAEGYNLRDGAIRLILSDPLPELVYTLRKLARRFRRAPR